MVPAFEAREDNMAFLGAHSHRLSWHPEGLAVPAELPLQLPRDSRFVFRGDLPGDLNISI